jgi:hypothetical protein
MRDLNQDGRARTSELQKSMKVFPRRGRSCHITTVPLASGLLYVEARCNHVLLFEVERSKRWEVTNVMVTSFGNKSSKG